jgi:hypothetical protein
MSDCFTCDYPDRKIEKVVNHKNICTDCMQYHRLLASKLNVSEDSVILNSISMANKGIKRVQSDPVLRG